MQAFSNTPISNKQYRSCKAVKKTSKIRSKKAPSVKLSSLASSYHLLPARVPRWTLSRLPGLCHRTNKGRAGLEAETLGVNCKTNTGALCWLIQAQVKQKSDIELITTYLRLDPLGLAHERSVLAQLYSSGSPQLL